MATNSYSGSSGNDSWTVINPGTFTLDGLGGTDTLALGTSLRSSYRITKSSDGAIHVDSVSGASGILHATLYNMEVLLFNSGRDKLDLTVAFGDTTPPTVSIADNVAGTAVSNVSYTLTFSETVTGLTASDFSVTNGSVVSVTGSGTSYTVVVAPASGSEAQMGLTLLAGAVTDAGGNVNAAATAAAQAVDTRPPTVSAMQPSDNATAVAVGSNIVITFSEAIQRGVGSIVITDAAGSVVASYQANTSAGVTVSGNALTIDPGNDFAYGSTLAVQVLAGAVVDTAGNAGAASRVYHFTTADPPVVDSLVGTAGNDSFAPAASIKSIDGGAGIDTVVLGGTSAGYQVRQTGTGFEVVSVGTGATLALTNVERLQYSDHKVAFDLTGHAGEVAKVLGAVFGAAAVGNQEYAGIGLQLADGGMSYAALMQLAITARLGSKPTNAEVVTLLYTNVVGSAPSPAELASFTALLDGGAYTPATLGILAADTSLNTAHIDLVGLSQIGLNYV